MLITSNTGELSLLEWMLKSTSTPEDLVLKLYSNNFSPTSTSVVANFTESTFGGYLSQTINRTGWGSASSVSGVATITYGTTFTYSATSSATIYGYFVVGFSTGNLYWSERLSTPRSVVSGSIIQITPQFTLDSGA